jgi:spore coat protein CotH
VTFPRECDVVYSHDALPTFELGISESVWTALLDDWANGYANKEAGLEYKPERPLDSFRYGDEVITNASVRLRGNPRWWAGQNKMQFEISFNAYDKEGRFHGLRHVLFDAARSNRSFLRDRLALSVMRDVGLPTPCANNARVIVNDTYYGLFTNIEKIDKGFLERNFAEANGNLYKRARWEQKTNEDQPDDERLDALRDATTTLELDRYMDLDEALLEWAAEAVLPDGDGAWAGGLNFYLYDHRETGFMILPWDLDATFTRLDYDVDPMTYLKEDDHGRPFYDLALSDPALRTAYMAALEHVLTTGYRADVLQARIDAWAAQIAQAAADDVNKPFTTDEHLAQMAEEREFVAQRAAFVAEWLSCWQGGGEDTDGDGRCEPL